MVSRYIWRVQFERFRDSWDPFAQWGDKMCQIATFSLLTQKLFNRFVQNFQVNCAFCVVKIIRVILLAAINAIKQPEFDQNFKGWLRFLTITSKRSNGFSQFLHYLFLQSQGIHCWHSYWATVFEWPWKSKSASGSKGTDDIIVEIFRLFMF